MDSDEEFELDEVEEHAEEKNPVLKNDRLKTHKCPYEGCNSAFNRPWRLTRHINSHTKERPFKCVHPGCSKDYPSKSNLQRHISVSHPDKKPLQVFIPCSVQGCEKVFLSKWGLKRHYYNSHKKNDRFKCGLCGETFKKVGLLKLHSKDRHDVHPFQCENCNESFAAKSDLRCHEKKHKAYICDRENCQEEFSTFNALRKHFKLAHPKVYTCDICGNTFVNKWTLTEHVISHLPREDRDVLICPYDECKRYYFYQRNLAHHIKSFHQEISYKCEINNCGKLFPTKSKLKKHEAVHSKPKTPCPPKANQPRKPRKDKGMPRKSMAALLSGIVLPEQIDKNLAQNNITPEVLDCIQNVKELLGKEMNSVESSNEITEKEGCDL